MAARGSHIVPSYTDLIVFGGGDGTSSSSGRPGWVAQRAGKWRRDRGRAAEDARRHADALPTFGRFEEAGRGGVVEFQIRRVRALLLSAERVEKIPPKPAAEKIDGARAAVMRAGRDGGRSRIAVAGIGVSRHVYAARRCSRSTTRSKARADGGAGRDFG
jgi:hypothetical protein